MTPLEESFKPIMFHMDRVRPLLEPHGFTGGLARTHKAGRAFQAKLMFDPEQMPTLQQCVQLYATDAWPVTSKREAVLHVWNGFGSDSKAMAKQIADILTRGGIPARATTHKKYNVVALSFDEDEFYKAIELEK